MHLQPVYAELGLGTSAFPATERSCSRLFGLPVGPHLDDDQIEEVIVALVKVCG
jgi:dTDP-4-amino-4,6-dideoxygalactose transaminase